MLQSADGRRFDLRIAGYQFPAAIGRGRGYDWDANWLVVEGRLELPDGRVHTFRDPCLTTGEAAELGEWLEHVALREPESAVDTSDPDALEMTFTEPCLAFHLAAATGEEIAVRVYLSLEAEPPWPVDGGTGLFSNYVTFVVSRAAAAAAAQDWREQSRRFPAR